MKTRNNNSYSSLEEIINALSKNPHGSSVWVGENYSKVDLIEDLKRLNEQLMPKLYGGASGGGMTLPDNWNELVEEGAKKLEAAIEEDIFQILKNNNGETNR